MRILIATDGSECSRAAISKWCGLTGRTENIEIKIISVYQNPYVPVGEPFTMPPEYIQDIVEGAKNQSGRFVDEAEKQIRESLGDAVKVTKEVVQGAEPEQRIIEEAETWAPDLIVVGSRGRGLWGRMLGSVSDAVVHHANCSVLVAR